MPNETLAPKELSARYERGKRTYYIKLAAMEKARMARTHLGEVPLILGRYGMTVGEYLQWVANREGRRMAPTQPPTESSKPDKEGRDKPDEEMKEKYEPTT